MNVSGAKVDIRMVRKNVHLRPVHHYPAVRTIRTVLIRAYQNVSQIQGNGHVSRTLVSLSATQTLTVAVGTCA